MSVVVAASLVDDDSELSSFLEEGILPEKLVILVEGEPISRPNGDLWRDSVQLIAHEDEEEKKDCDEEESNVSFIITGTDCSMKESVDSRDPMMALCQSVGSMSVSPLSLPGGCPAGLSLRQYEGLDRLRAHGIEHEKEFKHLLLVYLASCQLDASERMQKRSFCKKYISEAREWALGKQALPSSRQHAVLGEMGFHWGLESIVERGEVLMWENGSEKEAAPAHLTNALADAVLSVTGFDQESVDNVSKVISTFLQKECYFRESFRRLVACHMISTTRPYNDSLANFVWALKAISSLEKRIVRALDHVKFTWPRHFGMEHLEETMDPYYPGVQAFAQEQREKARRWARGDRHALDWHQVAVLDMVDFDWEWNHFDLQELLMEEQSQVGPSSIDKITPTKLELSLAKELLRHAGVSLDSCIWKSNFEMLLVHRLRFCGISGLTKERNPVVGKWLENLRYQKIADEQLCMILEWIRFDCSPRASDWEEKPAALIAYIAQHDKYPPRQSKGGGWASKIRQKKRKRDKALCHVFHPGQEEGYQSQLQRLDEIPFRWPKSQTWEDLFVMLVDYCQHHGDCLVPKSHKELGPWVLKQREDRQLCDEALAKRKQLVNEQLYRDRIQKLNVLGFQWSPGV